MRKTILLPLAPAVLLVVVGCGGGNKQAEVSGTVTVAGKGPLSGGTITFVSTANDKLTASGIIKSDGTYKITDAPVGECSVGVDNTHLDPARKGGGMGVGPAGMKGPGGMPGSKGPPGDAKGKMGAAPKDASTGGDMGKAESADAKFQKIEAVYASPTGSPLKFTVVAGTNTANFEVK